jgi:hypothetical protein
LPIIAELPLCQSATMEPPSASSPGTRPLSQSITDFSPAMSVGPPC